MNHDASTPDEKNDRKNVRVCLHLSDAERITAMKERLPLSFHALCLAAIRLGLERLDADPTEAVRALKNHVTKHRV